MGMSLGLGGLRSLRVVPALFVFAVPNLALAAAKNNRDSDCTQKCQDVAALKNKIHPDKFKGTYTGKFSGKPPKAEEIDMGAPEAPQLPQLPQLEDVCVCTSSGGKKESFTTRYQDVPSGLSEELGPPPNEAARTAALAPSESANKPDPCPAGTHRSSGGEYCADGKGGYPWKISDDNKIAGSEKFPGCPLGTRNMFAGNQCVSDRGDVIGKIDPETKTPLQPEVAPSPATNGANQNPLARAGGPGDGQATLKDLDQPRGLGHKGDGNLAFPKGSGGSTQDPLAAHASAPAANGANQNSFARADGADDGQGTLGALDQPKGQGREGDGRLGLSGGNGGLTEDQLAAHQREGERLVTLGPNNLPFFCPAEPDGATVDNNDGSARLDSSKCTSVTSRLKEDKKEQARLEKEKEAQERAEAEAKLRAADQPQQGLALGASRDMCGSTINSMWVKSVIDKLRARGNENPSRDEIVKFAEDDPEGRKLHTMYAEQYGCDADADKVSSIKTENQFTQVGTQVTAGIISGVNVGKAQQALGDTTKNFQKEATNAMADSMMQTGLAQTAAGALFIYQGARAGGVSKKHGKAVKDIENYDKSSLTARTGNNACADEQSEPGQPCQHPIRPDLTNAGAVRAAMDAQARTGEAAARQYNAMGSGYASSSQEKHKQLADQADTLSTTSYVQGVLSAAQGVTSALMGYFSKCDDGDMRPQCLGPQYSPPPQLTGGPPQGDASGSAPAPVTGVGGGNDTAPPAVLPTDVADATGADQFAIPPANSAAGSDSLAGKPVDGKGNLISGVGTGSASGGGGGGGVGGGGGGSGARAERPDAEKTLSMGSKKFADTVGGAGGSFASSGGSGSRRTEDTNMGLNGLFNALLPNNQQNNAKTSSILDFGSRGPASIGPGSEADDSSILGRNSTHIVMRSDNRRWTVIERNWLK